MNHTTRDKLWDFAYELLAPEESAELRAKIASNAQLSREYASVMLEIELLHQATSTTLYTVDFEISSEALAAATPLHRIDHDHANTLLTKRILWFMVGSLVVFLLGVAGTTYWSAYSPVRETALNAAWHALAEEHPRLLVTGPAELQTGLNASYQCLLHNLQNKPLQRQLQATMFDSSSRPLWRDVRSTDAGGELRFIVPTPAEEGYFQLVIDVAQKDEIENISTIETPAHLTEPLFKTWLPARGVPAKYWNSTNHVTFEDFSVNLNRHVALGKTPVNALETTSETIIKAALEIQPLTTKPFAEQAVPPVFAAGFSHESPLHRLMNRLEAPVSQARQMTLETLKHKPLLVEGLSIEHGIVGNRFLLASPEFMSETENASLAEHDPKTSTPARADLPSLLLDYETAPPETLHSSITNFPMAPLPALIMHAHFDRSSYAPGELATVMLNIRNAQNKPVQAILAVTVEQILESVPEPFVMKSPRVAAGNAASIPNTQPVFIDQLPLVFDNGRDQSQNLQLVFQDWKTHREVRRQYCSLILIFGSGVGYALVLVAALLKWLPRPLYLSPLVIALAITFLLGSNWLLNQDSRLPKLTLHTLVNYGVRQEKPVEPGKETKQASPRNLPIEPKQNHLLPQDNATAAVELPSIHDWLDTCHLPGTLTRLTGTESRSLIADFEIDLQRTANNNWHSLQLNSSDNMTAGDSTAATETFGNHAKQPRGTLYWHPLIMTPKNGVIQIQFEIPHQQEGLRLRVQSHTATNLGTLQKVVPVILPDSIHESLSEH